MNFKRTALALSLLSLAAAGCAVTQVAPLTPLEIQQIQSRTFEADKETTFRSVVSVLQDLGYTIKSADLNTGFITAESAAESDKTSKLLIGVASVSQSAVTAFIEDFGAKSSVRLNLVDRVETSSSTGQRDKQETPILEPSAYQFAFEKIEKAVFVRKAMR